MPELVIDLNLKSRAAGSLLGLACGDAVGTTVEFAPRGTFEPVTDMVGGGPFRLEAGQWTDDTSMALCLAASLLERDGFDPVDQLDRYVRWYRDGYMSSNGLCFDTGNTIRAALHTFEKTGNPKSGSTDPYSAGNGSIMRLAPVVLFYFPDHVAVDTFSAASSLTTHGAAEAVACCRILGGVLSTLLDGTSKEEAVGAVPPADWMSPALREIAAGTYTSKGRNDILGSGYAVACLEAALWCFIKTDTFEGAILAAANLGEDADTTAAVAGQLAGAFYGATGIPDHWLSRLAKRDMIEDFAIRLVSAKLRFGGEA